MRDGEEFTEAILLPAMRPNLGIHHWFAARSAGKLTQEASHSAPLITRFSLPPLSRKAGKGSFVRAS
jgi:hypothetical protein